MALNIGIDFGTSTIYVTRWNEKRKEAEPIPNIARSSKEQFIENIVYYESEDNLILGQKAKTKGIIHPENLVSYIKRHLNEPNWSQWIKSLNRKVTASEVATDIFKFLKTRIEEIHAKPIDAVVLSVPFAFGDKERQLIQSCAENAGLNVVQLIEEPISAGISYGFFHDDHAQDFDSQTILMFDLGGGTFDIAIFKLFRFDDQLNIEIIGTDGDKRLGGKDIDDMIFYKFCKQLNIKLSEIDETLSIRDANDLLNEAKKTKENLSELENYEIMLVLKDFGEVLEWELSQDDLEEWIIEMGFIRRIEDILNSALHNHSVSIDDLDQIILVGGTTNIPLIKRSVEKFFKRPIAMLKNPAEMVGEGNGILCGSLNDHQLKFNLIPPSTQPVIHQAITPLNKNSFRFIPDENQGNELKIGIDFSLDYIYATCWNERKNCIEPLKNITRYSGETFIDNAIYYDNWIHMYYCTIGNIALKKGTIEPDDHVADVRRFLDNHDYEWFTPIKSLEKELSIQEIITDIFKYLKNRIEELYNGTSIDKLTVNIPNFYNQKQSDYLKNAIIQAGFNNVQFIYDSMAMLLKIINDQEVISKRVCIVNINNHQTELHVMSYQIQNDQSIQCEQLLYEVDHHLNNQRINDVIYNKFIDFVESQLDEHQKPLVLSKNERFALKVEAYRTKEDLGVMTDTESISPLENRQFNLEMNITQTEFSQWLIDDGIMTHFDHFLKSSLKKSGIEIHQIDDIILRDESESTPVIFVEYLEKFFNKPLFYFDDQKGLIGDGLGIFSGTYRLE